MSKAGVPPGEYAIASTIEAFALQGDVEQVLALMEVGSVFVKKRTVRTDAIQLAHVRT